jgi:hypothetical protein
VCESIVHANVISVINFQVFSLSHLCIKRAHIRTHSHHTSIARACAPAPNANATFLLVVGRGAWGVGRGAWGVGPTGGSTEPLARGNGGAHRIDDTRPLSRQNADAQHPPGLQQHQPQATSELGGGGGGDGGRGKLSYDDRKRLGTGVPPELLAAYVTAGDFACRQPFGVSAGHLFSHLLISFCSAPRTPHRAKRHRSVWFGWGLVWMGSHGGRILHADERQLAQLYHGRVFAVKARFLWHFSANA